MGTTKGPVAHLPLDPAGVALGATGDHQLIQEFPQYAFVECWNVLRGERDANRAILRRMSLAAVRAMTASS